MCMAAQSRAQFGGDTGLAAYHQHGAGPVFQQTDALRYGRWRDVQQARGTLKAAFACHDGQGGEQGGVEHAADSTLAILNSD